MLKNNTPAYDERRRCPLRCIARPRRPQISQRAPNLGGEWVPFFKEIAIMAVLTTGGHTCSFPALETVHKDICHLVLTPFKAGILNLQRALKI